MGFLKDFWSGSLPSQNPALRRESCPPQTIPKDAASKSPVASNHSLPLGRQDTFIAFLASKSSVASNHSLPLSPSERARAKFEEGLDLCEARRVREGIEAFSAATEIDPNCIDAWFALGKCFHNLDPAKFADEILQCAEGALRADPNNAKSKNLGSAAYFKKGQVQFDARNWFQAYKHFERAYELNPDGGEDLLDMYVFCAEKAEKFPECAEHLRNRLAQTPEDEKARRILGRVLVKMSLHEPWNSDDTVRLQLLKEAEFHLTTFLSNQPLDPVANYFLGALYITSARTQEAEATIRKLASIDAEGSHDLQEMLNNAREKLIQRLG